MRENAMIESVFVIVDDDGNYLHGWNRDSPIYLSYRGANGVLKARIKLWDKFVARGQAWGKDPRRFKIKEYRLEFVKDHD